MTCFYSKWPEGLLYGETTVAVIIKWFRHLFARYGLPEEIVSDIGPQFRSNEYVQFLHNNATKYSRTVPYNPSANGMVERLDRTLKESVQTLQLAGESWEDAVVTALGNYRSTPLSTTTKTPAELMLGRMIRTILNVAFVSQLTIQSNSYANKNIRKSTGATVYLMHPILLFVYATLSLRKGIMQSRLKLIVWLVKRASMSRIQGWIHGCEARAQNGVASRF